MINTQFIVLFAVLTAMSACTKNDAQPAPAREDPLVEPSAQLAKLSGFSGRYVVVAARRSAVVSAPAAPQLDSPIGRSVTFTRNGVDIDLETDPGMGGVICAAWSINPISSPVIFVDSDPSLVDTTLAASDGPNSVGDQQQHLGFQILCENERYGLIHKVDDRVLIMPWANSTINLILERPLSELQIKAYQMQLKSMKFYEGGLTGTLDTDTLRASRDWYTYRAGLSQNQPIPARPAITENLLDALGIL